MILQFQFKHFTMKLFKNKHNIMQLSTCIAQRHGILSKSEYFNRRIHIVSRRHMAGIIKRDYKGSIPGAVIRPATHDDYEAVMDIDRNLYDGSDYLPPHYHEYIDNPLRPCYVCLKDNQIVGFEMLLISDEGEMLAREAGRVKPNYRHQGISSSLLDYAIMENSRNTPVKNIVWTTLNEKATRRTLEWNKQFRCTEFSSFEIRLEASALKDMIKSRDFEDVLSKSNADQFRELHQNEIIDTLSSLSKIPGFLQDNIWCIRREPFGIKTNFMLVTDEFKATALTSSNPKDHVDDLSFCSEKGIFVVMDFYASRHLSEQETSNLLIRHMIIHLKAIGESKETGLLHLCMFVHGYNRQTDELKQVMFNLLKSLDKQSWKYWERPFFVMRYPVEHDKDSQL